MAGRPVYLLIFLMPGPRLELRTLAGYSRCDSEARSCNPYCCIKLGPGSCLTTEENYGKTSVRAPEKWSAYQRRARFVWSTLPSTSGGLDWSAGTRRRRFALRATGPTLGQSRYLPSCRTKGFPASANFESSKLSVIHIYIHRWVWVVNAKTRPLYPR